MRRFMITLLYVVLVLTLAGHVQAVNYQYFTEIEDFLVPDWGLPFWNWHEDTTHGPLRTNDTLEISENPVYYDFVITAAPDFTHGWEYNPQFHGPDPIFNAPALALPDSATSIRAMASEQGFFFSGGDSMHARVRILHDTLRVWWALQGMPFDTASFQDVLLQDSTVVFFDAPVSIAGVVSTVLIIGASGRVGLEDDIHYVHTSGVPEHRATPGHPEKFALVSEGEIKILNTPANGRENSNGAGFNQMNPNLTDICLNGIYVALNESFTFDQQNDPDSGYVCQCQPDDRGTIYLSGGLLQKRKGHIERSTNTHTGYGKQYRDDTDLRFWNIGLWSDTLRENLVEPTQISFGQVMVGDTAWDTVRVYNDFVPVALSNISSGFELVRPGAFDSAMWCQQLIVGFAPAAPGLFAAPLTFVIPYYARSFIVGLAGIGVANAAVEPAQVPQEFGLHAYPNPFNSRAILSFTLPIDGAVNLELYDVQGRLVATLAKGIYSAGEHSVSVDGSQLASGVYLARLTTINHIASTKLLLLK